VFFLSGVCFAYEFALWDTVLVYVVEGYIDGRNKWVGNWIELAMFEVRSLFADISCPLNMFDFG
jgi:hypothetical protein